MNSEDRHKEAFVEESKELLFELESALLELEERPGDTDLVGRVFRALHTIKGSGAMFGFDNVSEFVHDVENLLDFVRDGKVPVTKELIDLVLAAKDRIREMLVDGGGGTVDSVRGREITDAVRSLLPAERDGEKRKRKKKARSGESVSRSRKKRSIITYRIRFKPSRDIFRFGINPVPLLNELRELGACKIVAHIDEIPFMKGYDPEACYTYWDIILTTNRGIDEIRDVFIFVEDQSEVRIEVIDDTGMTEEGIDYKKLGEILVERGDLSSDALKKALAMHGRIGEQLVEAGMVDPGKVESALIEQQQVRDVREKRSREDAISSIRVASVKLDKLVDLVGELVTVQAQLTQKSLIMNDPGLILIAEDVERLVTQLRDNTMEIRMVPIGTIFSKFKRLVRDLSDELSKKVDMQTDGGETELDKTVIDKLNDPLVHIVRNSIDHGIELPLARKKAGKVERGTIGLSAVHAGSDVIIKITDDGAGIDPEAVRARAIEKGLINEYEELSEKDIYSLILAPGFSTAEDVTSVSGRGVGMDVVKKALDDLRGKVEVDSMNGIGTTVTLKLPLTLAIIEGLLIRIGIERFVIPLSLVEECVEFSRDDVARSHGRNLVKVRGEIVPYIRLREWFAIHGDSPDIEQIVIIHSDGRRIGFAVDNVIGEHQTVIKSLGKYYRDVKGLSGATILGDGGVALILDISQIVRDVEHFENMEIS